MRETAVESHPFRNVREKHGAAGINVKYEERKFRT